MVALEKVDVIIFAALGESVYFINSRFCYGCVNIFVALGLLIKVLN